MCVLSLKPEPTVVCCNGVCNARILSIVSVPNLPGTKPQASNQDTGQWNNLTNQSSAQWTSSASDWSGGGWKTPSTGWSTPDSGTVEWGGGGGVRKYKHWTGSEGGTADSSPQSGDIS